MEMRDVLPTLVEPGGWSSVFWVPVSYVFFFFPEEKSVPIRILF
jgi:hypothetical protein